MDGPPNKRNGELFTRRAQDQKYATTLDNGTNFAQFKATYPVISEETLRELIKRELFQLDGHCWRFGDQNNGCTRRVDGGKWKRSDNKGDAWHKLIGLSDVVENNRQHVLLVIEGSKDALAAAEIAYRSGVLAETGVVCALGSGYRPQRFPAELEQLRGRYVRVIGDADAAGAETAVMVASALAAAQVEHEIWDWVAALLPGERQETDGDCKDLYACLFFHDQLAAKSERTASGFFGFFVHNFFFLPFPLLRFNRSTVQPFNRAHVRARARARGNARYQCRRAARHHLPLQSYTARDRPPAIVLVGARNQTAQTNHRRD